MIVFSGNVNLLVAAPMLQDSFVDKDGSPMSAGIITCYHDNSRTTLKNWYYQTSNGGKYIYIALPNPLTLSAAGTICDINGVDTIPFFYPYDETNDAQRDPYYITIVNYEQTNQITRENFPFLAPSGAGSTSVNSFNNLIINNGFWRNVLPNATNITPFSSFTYDSTTLAIPLGDTNYTAVVAPSQHDGFRMPDIQYQQAILTGTNTVTFTPFPLGNSQPISGNIVPEYYLSHVCSAAGTSQTQKCYQFPISLHLNTVANLPFTFSIQAQNGGGTSPGENVITIFLLQDTGTGGTAVPPIELITYSLNSIWTEYTFSGFFPATSGLNLGNGADDAWYLQVQMPLNISCTINFTKPSIYLTENILPTNDFQTYDQVDTVINSPRTGDIRTSLNSFYYFGWLPMNDNTIGNNLSNATLRANIDCWPLYNLLWNSFYQFSTGTGTSGANPIAQMYNSANTAVGYGVSITGSGSAISDWNANKALALTKAVGQVLTGTVPPSAFTSNFTAVAHGTNSGGNLLITSFTNFTGSPVTFSNVGGALPTGLSPNTIYYAVVSTPADRDITWYVATSYANAMAKIVIPYADSGSGTNRVSAGGLGISYGQYGHVQLEGELAAHNHPGSTDRWTTFNTLNGTVGSFRDYAVFGTPVTPVDVAIDGSNLPFNIMQPSTWYNLFIKL
jgi:hypothetical protein